MMSKKAVVLLSGGLDSTTAAAIAKAEGYELYGLTFEYGQRHFKEIVAACRVASALDIVRHEIIGFDLRRFGGSALTDKTLDVPQDRDDISSDVPITYVPARNTIFLSFALAFAETVGADTIVIGANQIDYSGYPDCREEYLNAFEKLADLATRAGTEGTQFKIYAPLLHMTKAEIIKRGIELGVDYSLTWSCYLGGDEPCGKCDSCILRAKGFEEAGIGEVL